jgi:hypothetical protein
MSAATDANQLAPYRLEWRPDRSTQWMLITTLAEHPGDLKEYVAAQDGWDWHGQWRLISQHVIDHSD